MQLVESEAVFPRVFGFPSIDSTNLELERIYQPQLPEFSAVIAAEQTAGKGRLGRSWQSAPESSLSLSVLVRPRSASEQSWLTLVAGLSVAEALGELGVEAGIKWPNDVLVKEKKICGILATGLGDAVILGVGVNLKRNSQQLATAIALGELGVDISLDSIAARIGLRLKANIISFRSDCLAVMDRFRTRCITLTQQVRAEFPDGTSKYGVASEVNGHGQLVILTPEPLALSAADVWHLRN